MKVIHIDCHRGSHKGRANSCQQKTLVRRAYSIFSAVLSVSLAKWQKLAFYMVL